jgi:hypothetical protein
MFTYPGRGLGFRYRMRVRDMGAEVARVEVKFGQNPLLTFQRADAGAAEYPLGWVQEAVPMNLISSLTVTLTPPPARPDDPPPPPVLYQSNGDWALFRLLSQGSASGSGSGWRRIRFGSGPRAVTIELKPDGPGDPFDRKALWTFSCPQP